MSSSTKSSTMSMSTTRKTKPGKDEDEEEEFSYMTSTLNPREMKALRVGTFAPRPGSSKPLRGCRRGKGLGEICQMSAEWSCVKDTAPVKDTPEPVAGQVDLRGAMLGRWEPSGCKLAAVGLRDGTCALLQYTGPEKDEDEDEEDMDGMTMMGDRGSGIMGVSGRGMGMGMRSRFGPPKEAKLELISILNGKGRGNRGANNNKANDNGGVDSPLTALSWRPVPRASGSRNLLVTGNSNGRLQMYHATSEKLLWTGVEEGNQVYTLAHRADGRVFASGGKDAKIRLYDEHTLKNLLEFPAGDGVAFHGHTSSIYSLAWHPTNHNILFSTGWDKTLKMWDTRQEDPVKSLFGMYVCGDGLDIGTDDAGVSGYTALTGSWRSERALQLWDVRNDALVMDYKFEESANEPPTSLYAAKFLPGGRAIAAGGSGHDPSVRFFDTQTGAILAHLPTTESLHSLDYAKGGQCLITTAEGCGVLEIPDVLSSYTHSHHKEDGGTWERPELA